MAATGAIRARVVCAAHVPSAFATERALHTILSRRRVNARREFFRASYVEARSLFALLAEGYSQPEVALNETSAASDPVRVWASPRASLGAGICPGQSQLGQETCLRSWVESNYAHLPLREKDTGTKLEALYGAYVSTAPPVHMKLLGRNKFAAMLSAVYQNIGPHKSTRGTVGGLYLLR